jgi:hypothetical protein
LFLVVENARVTNPTSDDEIDPFAPARANLFPGALPHIANWDEGRLEARSRVVWSSQALCISVWGAIAESDRRRAIVLDALGSAGIELEAEGMPEIECEVHGRRDVLNEYGGSNPTCPDAIIRLPGAALTIESKFTEPLGRCSQVKSQRTRTAGGWEMRPPACSGNHEVGSDLRTKTDAACRLTIAEGDRTPRRYWEVGARLFRRAFLTPPRSPCPFRGPHYQLMRNLTFAAALAELEARPTDGFLLAYVEQAAGATATRRTFGDFKAMLLPEVARRVGMISYEQLTEIVHRRGEHELAAWIDVRLPSGIRSRPRSPRFS